MSWNNLGLGYMYLGYENEIIRVWKITTGLQPLWKRIWCSLYMTGFWLNLWQPHKILSNVIVCQMQSILFKFGGCAGGHGRNWMYLTVRFVLIGIPNSNKNQLSLIISFQKYRSKTPAKIIAYIIVTFIFYIQK